MAFFIVFKSKEIEKTKRSCWHKEVQMLDWEWGKFWAEDSFSLVFRKKKTLIKQTLDRSFSRPSPYPYKLWFYPLALINYLVIEPIKKRPYWRCITIFILFVTIQLKYKLCVLEHRFTCRAVNGRSHPTTRPVWIVCVAPKYFCTVVSGKMALVYFFVYLIQQFGSTELQETQLPPTCHINHTP